MNWVRMIFCSIFVAIDTRPDIIRKNRRVSIKQSSIFDSNQNQYNKTAILKKNLSKPPLTTSTAVACVSSSTSTTSKGKLKNEAEKSKAALFGIKRVNRASVEIKESAMSIPQIQQSDRTETPVPNLVASVEKTASRQATKEESVSVPKTCSVRSNVILLSSLGCYQSSSSGSEIDDGID